MKQNIFSRIKNAIIVKELTETKELKNDILTGATVAMPTSIKETPRLERVSKDELELAYLHVPAVYNGINKITQNIMSARHDIESKNVQVKEFFDTFTKNIGNTGVELTWEELLERIFKDLTIYGLAYVELIKNKSGKKILDLDILDAKRIDYAKDSLGQIVLDEIGRPVGYTQKLSTAHVDQKFEVPDEVELGNGLLFIPEDRIALFKFNTFGDGFYPVGLIEPAYKQIVRKLNLEEAYANANYRHVLPIIHASVGDPTHQPTPEQLNKTLDKLKLLDYKKEIATPYFYELNLLQAKRPENLDSAIKYFEDELITSMGSPKPFVIGSGEATNRSTLVTQNRMWQLSLGELIERTIANIRKHIFAPLSEQRGFNEVPNIVWADIGIEERDDKANRLLSYVKEGILTAKEVRPIIINLEGLRLE